MIVSLTHTTVPRENLLLTAYFGSFLVLLFYTRISKVNRCASKVPNVDVEHTNQIGFVI